MSIKLIDLIYMRCKLFFLLTIVYLFVGCEDVITIDVPEEDAILVVEGRITDQPGRQEVKLTYSTAYFDTASPPPATGLSVRLSDDQGREEMLQEDLTKPGIYVTEVPGEVGHSYVLEVTLADGRVYRSNPEMLSAVSEITSLDWEVTDPDEEPDEDGTTDYSILLSSREPPDETNFYRWRIFINDSLQGEPEDLAFARDDFVNEFVRNIEIYIGDMKPGDKVRVEQLGITESYFDFLNILFSQTAFQGGLFDSPPAPIESNIRNIDDDQDYALGYFYAAGMSVDSLVIGD